MFGSHRFKAKRLLAQSLRLYSLDDFLSAAGVVVAMRYFYFILQPSGMSNAGSAFFTGDSKFDLELLKTLRIQHVILFGRSFGVMLPQPLQAFIVG